MHLKRFLEAPAWPAHHLLQISGATDLVHPEGYPLWVSESLQQAPFVVVRRAAMVNGMVPVGVRGSVRNQRFATYLAPGSILKEIAPEQLVGMRATRTRVQSEGIPAFDALTSVETKLAGFPLRWGPTGSVGFELATGSAAATAASDLDLLIRVPERLSVPAAAALLANLSTEACGVDVQLETPRGAVSLAEYARGKTPILIRQTSGPVLAWDPWDPAADLSKTDFPSQDF